eukprot:m.678998 g.678998  ORF g.678998 m.678998 type:complete len:57 (+) comp58582_c0_seq6:1272-1442(+)
MVEHLNLISFNGNLKKRSFALGRRFERSSCSPKKFKALDASMMHGNLEGSPVILRR